MAGKKKSKKAAQQKRDNQVRNILGKHRNREIRSQRQQRLDAENTASRIEKMLKEHDEQELAKSELPQI